jgi:hypothetical protein
MTESKKPTLMVVAGREGPAEGPDSNATKIADAKARRKRGRPRTSPDTSHELVRDVVDEKLSAEGYTKTDTDQLHARAFRDLESRVCDFYRWAELADRLVPECVCDQSSWRELELAALVVERLSVSR